MSRSNLKGTKMTPDQITQLRQFIKNWQTEAGKYSTKTKFEAVLVDVINTKCDSLLTLLSCETCNGDGVEVYKKEGVWLHRVCPDCQQHSP